MCCAFSQLGKRPLLVHDVRDLIMEMLTLGLYDIT